MGRDRRGPGRNESGKSQSKKTTRLPGLRLLWPFFCLTLTSLHSW